MYRRHKGLIVSIGCVFLENCSSLHGIEHFLPSSVKFRFFFHPHSPLFLRLILCPYAQRFKTVWNLTVNDKSLSYSVYRNNRIRSWMMFHRALVSDNRKKSSNPTIIYHKNNWPKETSFLESKLWRWYSSFSSVTLGFLSFSVIVNKSLKKIFFSETNPWCKLWKLVHTHH